MNRGGAIVLIVSVLAVMVRGQMTQTAPASSQPAIRFTYVNVYIDSKDQPLAAYQFELKTTAGSVEIVGIEGGEHQAFAEPPYYDPAALRNDRVIIAAFNTGKQLPTGKTRIARVHLQISGDESPQFSVDLQVAGSTDGQTIEANISIVQGGNG